MFRTDVRYNALIAPQIAGKYKRFKVFEATRNDAEARAGDPVAPGVPTEVLRGVEKGR